MNQCFTLLISLDIPLKHVFLFIHHGSGVYDTDWMSYLLKCSCTFSPTARGTQGLSGYCFHPWCPDGLEGGWAAGKSLSGLYLRNRYVRCRKLILGRDIG